MNEIYTIVTAEMYPTIRNNDPIEAITYMGIHPETLAALTVPPTAEQEKEFQDFLRTL